MRDDQAIENGKRPITMRTALTLAATFSVALLGLFDPPGSQHARQPGRPRRFPSSTAHAPLQEPLSVTDWVVLRGQTLKWPGRKESFHISKSAGQASVHLARGVTRGTVCDRSRTYLAPRAVEALWSSFVT